MLASALLPRWTINTLLADADDLNTSLNLRGADAFLFVVTATVATGTPTFTLFLNASAADQELGANGWQAAGGGTGNSFLTPSFVVAGGWPASSRFKVWGELHQEDGVTTISYATAIDDGVGGWLELWRGTGEWFGVGPVLTFGLNSDVSAGILAGSTIRVQRMN